jgi:hypothetical protein
MVRFSALYLLAAAMVFVALIASGCAYTQIARDPAAVWADTATPAPRPALPLDLAIRSASATIVMAALGSTEENDMRCTVDVGNFGPGTYDGPLYVGWALTAEGAGVGIYNLASVLESCHLEPGDSIRVEGSWANNLLEQPEYIYLIVATKVYTPVYAQDTFYTDDKDPIRERRLDNNVRRTKVSPPIYVQY